MPRYKEIIGGTEAELHLKFPWIEKAEVTAAVIDISENHLVWEHGIWKDGIWKDGKMWCNLKQSYVAVKQVGGSFKERES